MYYTLEMLHFVSLITRMNHPFLTISGSHTSGNSYINVVLYVLLEIKGKGGKKTHICQMKHSVLIFVFLAHS